MNARAKVMTIEEMISPEEFGTFPIDYVRSLEQFKRSVLNNENEEYIDVETAMKEIDKLNFELAALRDYISELTLDAYNKQQDVEDVPEQLLVD